VIQQDSIQTFEAVEGSTDVVLHRPLTPAQVLSWLPRTATPAQQDSAIQAHFKPSEIHWSNRPDTLHLPGHDKGHNMLDVQLPQYYREGFFSEDSLFHPELPGGRYGTAGDPVPYSVRGDNVITSLLLLGFMLAVIAFSSVRHFVVRQINSYIFPGRAEATDMTETAGELRFQLFLVGLSALFLSILFYFYTISFIGDTFLLEQQYLLILIFFLVAAVYYLMKAGLYALVNNVFFDSKRNEQWLKSYLFITSVESVVMFPLVLLQAYFSMPFVSAVTYFVIALIFVKLLTIYKCYYIFFRRNVVILQIILYFCALEIVPLLILWGVLDLTAKSLIINY